MRSTGTKEEQKRAVMELIVSVQATAVPKHATPLNPKTNPAPASGKMLIFARGMLPKKIWHMQGKSCGAKFNLFAKAGRWPWGGVGGGGGCGDSKK